MYSTFTLFKNMKINFKSETTEKIYSYFFSGSLKTPFGEEKNL